MHGDKQAYHYTLVSLTCPTFSRALLHHTTEPSVTISLIVVMNFWGTLPRIYCKFCAKCLMDFSDKIVPKYLALFKNGIVTPFIEEVSSFKHSFNSEWKRYVNREVFSHTSVVSSLWSEGGCDVFTTDLPLKITTKSSVYTCFLNSGKSNVDNESSIRSAHCRGQRTPQ